MSVETTAARMAAMWANIEGIKRAFDKIPRVIQDVECPCVIFFPGAATYELDEYGDNDGMEIRLWTPTVFVRPAYQGTERQSQIALEPFFDRIRDYLLARPGLELEGATPPQEVVYEARLLGDSGYQAIPYATDNEGTEKVFHAIVFQHQVKEWFAITYNSA